MHENAIINAYFDRTKSAVRVTPQATLPAEEILPSTGGATGEETSIDGTPVQFVAANAARRSGVVVRNKGTEELAVGYSAVELEFILKADEWVAIPTSAALWVKNTSGSAGELCYLEA